MTTRIVFVVLCVLLVSGCVTTSGKKMDMEAVARLQPGVTTFEEVRAMLGPYMTETIGNGVHAYVWDYTMINTFTGKSEGQMVVLAFDQDGVLVSRR